MTGDLERSYVAATLDASKRDPNWDKPRDSRPNEVGDQHDTDLDADLAAGSHVSWWGGPTRHHGTEAACSICHSDQ